MYSTDIYLLGSDLVTLHMETPNSAQRGVTIIASTRGQYTQSLQVDARVGVGLMKCSMNSHSSSSAPAGKAAREWADDWHIITQIGVEKVNLLSFHFRIQDE